MGRSQLSLTLVKVRNSYLDSETVSGGCDFLAALSFYLLLTLNLPATAHHKIDEGAEKGKEDDNQDPDDFVISREIIFQYTDQGH